MKVEIWSDVACPFCYIGKKRFEKALGRFANKDQIEVEWKSYQLDPTLPAAGSESLPEYLARQKGMSLADVGRMFENVQQMASEEGIEMNMDRVKAANTATMHRLIQLAKTRGMGAKAEEEFFKAYFSGQDFTDEHVLLEIARAIGLEPTEAQAVIVHSEAYAEEMARDIYEARSIGVQGVPFFVFNDKYTVSGAQHADTFQGALEKSFQEWEEANGAS